MAKKCNKTQSKNPKAYWKEKYFSVESHPWVTNGN